MIPDHLRLQPGQQALTPAQEAEAWRFIKAFMQRQFSTDPVDEKQANACLRQAYQVAGLPPPARIRWVNGPREVLSVVVPGRGDTGHGHAWPANVHHQVKYRPSRLDPRPPGWVSRRLWEIMEWVSWKAGIFQGEERDVGLEGEYHLEDEVWLHMWDGAEARVRTAL
jgi:hypothetical protein